MAAPAKTINVLGLTGKSEATYGTYNAPATTSDGILLTYTDRNVGAPITRNVSFDGNIGINPGNLGNRKQVAPSGISWQGDLPVRFKGAGAAYAAATTPDNHVLLKAAGFDAAVVTTSAAETWTYTPTLATTAYGSASLDMYARGQKYALAGVIAEWGFTFDTPAPPIHTFSIRGIQNAYPTDVTLPDITYPNLTIEPPLASAITLVIGSFTTLAVAYSGSFKMNRNHDNPRVALTASGAHLGFTPAGRAPEFKVVVEATAFVGSPYHTSAGLDHWHLRDAATNFAASVVFGSTQYNKWKLNMPQVQLTDVVEQNTGPIATVELTLKPYCSTPIANDDFTILFD